MPKKIKVQKNQGFLAQKKLKIRELEKINKKLDLAEKKLAELKLLGKS